MIDGLRDKAKSEMMMHYNTARLAGQIARGGKISFPWDEKRTKYSSGVRDLIEQYDQIDELKE